MNRRSLFFLLFAFSFLGCSLSMLARQLLPAGTFAVWRPLGSPPEAPGSIAALTPGSGKATEQVNVYVRTVSGAIYHRLNTASDTWMPVQLAKVPTGPWSTCPQVTWPDWPDKETPYWKRIPGTVSDCAKIRYSWEVFLDEMIIVLLADGSLWYYHNATNLFQFLAFPLSGILIGAMAALFTHARQKRSSSPG